VLLLLVGATLSAQDARKNEIGLLLGGEVIPGRSTAAGGKIAYSSSIAFSANYARRLMGDSTALFLEFPFAAVPSHKVTIAQPGAVTDLATLYVTPSLRVQFANKSTISPWFSGGFGYGLYEGSELLNDRTRNPDRHQHTGTAQFGAGVDVRTPVKILFPIGLRAEVRDYYTVIAPNYGVPVRGDSQHNLVFAGGIVLRF
jgi:hypothetical protein